MLRSMFSAISGLRSHQFYLDVVGNNIANVNTTAFKGARLTFRDMLSQTIRGSGGTQEGRSGINSAQVGLGVLLGTVDTMNIQGNLRSTGRLTDLAIDGDGYFALSDGSSSYYTRDGTFDVAYDGTLVNPASGLSVMGWLASNGIVDTTQPLSALLIPLGQGILARATSGVTLSGNLNSEATEDYSTTTVVYDSLGAAHEVTLTFEKTAANTWEWTASTTDADVTLTPPASTEMTFDSEGALATPPTSPTLLVSFATGAAASSVSLDLSALTQLAASSEVTTVGNGVAPGSMVTFSIGAAGEVYGIYSNGLSQQLGQVAMATFANPASLTKAGGNLYQTSANSGNSNVGIAGTGNRGTMASGFLEMSNVDLALEFTNMILAERGFQANAKVITTSDEMLQELVNIKR